MYGQFVINERGETLLELNVASHLPNPEESQIWQAIYQFSVDHGFSDSEAREQALLAVDIFRKN